VVITFIDITTHKQLEKAALRFAVNIVQTIRHPLLVLDNDLVVLSASPSFTQLFSVPDEEVVGKVFYELGNPQWDTPDLHGLLEDVLLRNGEFADHPVEHNFPGPGHKRLLLSGHRIVQPEINRQMIILSFEEA
jgi:PAS domain-containing protein